MTKEVNIELSTYLFNESNRKDPLVSLRDIMAKSSTLCSNRALELRANVRRAGDALSVIIISSCFPELIGYWQTEVLIRSCAQRAFANRYSGNWKVVQEILETSISGPEELIAELQKHFSSEDIFGNLIPNAQKYWKIIQLYDPNCPKIHRPRRPQFHRGYRDKGSRRLAHERHGIPNYRDIEVDRRHKVQINPLVQLSRTEDSQSEDWPEDSVRPSE